MQQYGAMDTHTERPTPRGHWLSARVTDAELQRAQEIAKAHDLTVAQLVRRAVRREIRRREQRPTEAGAT